MVTMVVVVVDLELKGNPALLETGQVFQPHRALWQFHLERQSLQKYFSSSLILDDKLTNRWFSCGSGFSNLNPHDDGVNGLCEQFNPGHPFLVVDRTASFLARARLQHFWSPANVGSGWYLDILLFHAFLGHWEWRKALTPGQRKNTQDIRNIFWIFFLFSVRISHGMENRSWNLCWVRSLLHLVELTHKVEWSKVGLTHKEKLGCWDVIGWAQGKCEGKQDEENWDWLIVSSEALVVTPFWLFLFNLPA